MFKTMLTGALMLTAAVGQETRRVEIHTMDGPVAADAVAVQGAPFLTTFQGTPFLFEKQEMVLEGGVVKGAPYSADAVTETTQTLADGNRIHRTTKATLYRDSEGRTRRESTLGEIGPLTAAGEPIQTVMINDPVAGTTYMMDSRSKIAHKMPAKGEMVARAKAAFDTAKAAKMKAEGEFGAAGMMVTGSGDGNMTYVRVNRQTRTDSKDFKKESLGTQMMEGVSADGTRTTFTIPAGQIGNELPIQVVTESWYSPQLKSTVMTKTTDPRMGETVYKLTNVKLSEPDPSLFAPPPDITVQ